jgi:hypothetical protein
MYARLRTPYYAGKGVRNRAYIDHGHLHRPNKDENILIFERSSEQEAFKTETELINNWGRKDLDLGVLQNHTNGGEGASGYIFTEKQRQKLSQLNTGEGNPFFGKKHGDGFRAKRIGHSTSVETRLKMSEIKVGNKNAVGHKWEQVGTPEQLSDWGNKGHHVRWHVKRGVVSLTCSYCGEGK